MNNGFHPGGENYVQSFTWKAPQNAMPETYWYREKYRPLSRILNLKLGSYVLVISTDDHSLCPPPTSFSAHLLDDHMSPKIG